MREFDHGIRLGRVAAIAVSLVTTLGLGSATASPPPDLATLGDCAARPPGQRMVGATRPRVRLEERLDAAGTLTGYAVRIGARPIARLGVGGFVDGPFGSAVVVGERDADGTRLVLLDLLRRCATNRIVLDQLVYGSRVDPLGGLHLSLVEPGTRRELGIWAADLGGTGRLRREVAPPSGAIAIAQPRSAEIVWRDGRPVGRWCALGACEERTVDGHAQAMTVDPDTGGGTLELPVVAPRPVPEEPVLRWSKDLLLRYRWHPTETPPAWMRGALDSAADDASRTDRSRAPWFAYDPAATDSVRYTDTFPAASCATSIACASYVIGESWTVRFRPHGKDFRWGTLRWCQADDRDGCFDVERVMVHELGHIQGLDHPESGGFGLRPHDSVMHSLAPSRPKPGWQIHRFGPCDVATLQERYDVPDPGVAISTCNDVATTLALSGSHATVSRGTRVTLVAELRIPDRDAYGRLGGNALGDRAVVLRRRSVGTAAWTSFAMRPGTSPGTYLLSLKPSVSYEFQAVFTAPGTEGLGGSTSPVVTVRVTDGCTTTSCVNGMEDPME